MFKMNMDARKSRPSIFQYRPTEIPLTVKRWAVHQIIMTSMWLFVRFLVNDVLERICFDHTLKIQIKYFPRLTTRFYGKIILQEWVVWNNTLITPKVIKFFFPWSCGGEKSVWKSLMTPSSQCQRIFRYMLALAVYILWNPASIIWWRGKGLNSTATHSKTTMNWFIKWVTTLRCAFVLLS